MEKQVNALDFVNRLAVDPEYQSRIADGDERWRQQVAARMAKLQPLLLELRDAGIEVSSPEELLSCGRIDDRVVKILFNWLCRDGLDSIIQSSILTGLRRPKRPYSGAPLIRLWEATTSEAMKWEIAYTIAEAKPTGVSDWLLQELSKPQNGTAREWLFIAAAKLAPESEANERIIASFDDVPDSTKAGITSNGIPEAAAKALALSGGRDELMFLEDAYSGRKRSPIPTETDHRFRRKAITHSG